VHVPYKGGGASVIAVMAGETQWYFSPASSVIGHVRSGKLRAVAHSMPQRTALLPDVPTVADTVKGFNYSAWNGIILPKGTPAPVVEKIRAALFKTLANPEVREALNKQGAEVVTGTAEEFRALVQAEIESTGKVIKAADLKAE
jgi:tripartite-type tricarboxylate transporter receptor subunit TctC